MWGWLSARVAGRFPAARPAFVTLSVFGTGAYASQHQQDLSACELFFLAPPAATWSLEANLLCAFVVITVVGVFWHESDSAVQRRQNDLMRDELAKQQAEIRKQQDRLPEFLRTLPAEDFLNLVALAVDQVVDLVRAPGGDTSAKIRSVLTAIATLAKEYDAGTSAEPSKRARYCANLMIFVTGPTPWRQVLKFDSDLPEELRRGILALPLSYSATYDSGGQPDPELSEIALPVPIDPGSARANGSGGWRILPGAPSALVRKKFDFVGDTSQLGTWFDTEGHFLDGVKRDAIAHFEGKQGSMRGFFSVPVFAHDPGISAVESRHVAAVLNVHWNTVGKFEGATAARLFANTVYPLISALSVLLEGCPVPDPGLPVLSGADDNAQPPSAPAS